MNSNILFKYLNHRTDLLINNWYVKRKILYKSSGGYNGSRGNTLSKMEGG